MAAARLRSSPTTVSSASSRCCCSAWRSCRGSWLTTRNCGSGSSLRSSHRRCDPPLRHAVTTLPTSTLPFIVGLIGLLFAGTGVAFSAYQTLNHVAAVPRRLRAGFVSRYVRVFLMLATLLLGALAVGALTVVVTALPGVPEAERAAGGARVGRDHLRRFAVRRPAAARAPRAGPCPLAGRGSGRCGGDPGAQSRYPIAGQAGDARPGPSTGASPPWPACSPCSTWSTRRWSTRLRWQPFGTPACGREPWMSTAPRRPTSAR